MRAKRYLAAVMAMMLAAAGVVAAAMTTPAAADPPPKEAFSAELTGTSETTYPDPEQPDLFHQVTTFDVDGSFGNKAMTGTLTYEYEVLLRGDQLPPELSGAFKLNPEPPPEWILVSQATLETNLGNLSWEDSPYSQSHLFFECLPDATYCSTPGAAEHNAVVLNFASDFFGTGIFLDHTFPELWTMRVERDGPENGDVTGRLSGGIGRSFRYCVTGQVDTVEASPGSDWERETTVSLASINPAECRDELGNPVNNSLEAGPVSLDFQYNWDYTGEVQNQKLYPDVSATLRNGPKNIMTGATQNLFDLGGSGYRTTIVLGSQWGDIEGVYSKYPSVYLDLSFFDPDWADDITGPGSYQVEGTINGYVTVYDPTP